MIYRLFVAATASLWLAFPALAQSLVIPGERALTSKAVAEARLRLPSEATPTTAAELAPVSEGEIEAVRARNRGGSKAGTLEAQQRRITIGLARAIPSAPITASAMRWIAVPGGYAARAAITSPDAGSLRLAIELAGAPGDVEMVFFGSAAARLEGPVKVSDIADKTRAWWSPLTEGSTQTVEFFVPQGREPRSLALAVTAASHVFTSPSTGLDKRVQDIGTAGSCNIDLPCSSLASSTPFRNTADAVAQMVFHDAGFTILCTGTLLADSDTATQTPWFYSANHCFENDDPPYKTPAQMQAVANTLATLWRFEASACNSRTVRSDWVQLTGGATYLYSNPQNDVLFVRLNSAPPAGAYFAGWDASPITSGTAITSIHHPEGDLKKVTQGSVVRFSTPGVANGAASFIEALWSLGTTEAGSSGGGLWTTSGGEYYFRGGLWGGAAACSSPSGTDHFSRFDQVYPQLSSYLGASAAPSIDYSDLWWNPNESGWGLNLIQHPSRAIFGVWYTYEADGTRTWYVMPGGAWTSSTSYTGALYATTGPPFNAPFKSDQVDTRQVGTATLTFSNTNNGTFAYSVDGVSGTKSITRQPF